METTQIDTTLQIVNLQGRAFIIAQDGVVKPVIIGQILLPGSLLLTDSNTHIVYAEAPSGQAPVIVPVNDEVATADITDIQAAILAGLDPGKLFEPTAAGNQNPVGAFTGSSGNAGFVVVDRVGDSRLAESGFDTAFANNIEPVVIDELDPLLAANNNFNSNIDSVNSIPELTVDIDPPLTPTNSFPQTGSNVAFVEESALPSGSNDSSNNESTTGRFNINTGNDALEKLELQQANGDWIDVTRGGLVTGNYGSVTVTLVNGEYQWRYDLTGAIEHPKENKTGANDVQPEDFAIRVTDDDGDQAIASLTINILDDGPEAYADSNTVQEGGSASGNVLSDGTPDVFGADGRYGSSDDTVDNSDGVKGVKAGSDTDTPVLEGLGTLIQGQYGQLILHADGRYTYNSTANQTPPDGATDVFTYSIKDGDGDLSTTTLTIQLSDSGLEASTSSVVVYEQALDFEQEDDDLAPGTVVGSIPGDTRETQKGQLTATGGIGALKYSLEARDPVDPGQGDYGQIVLNADGSYTYTLTRPVSSSTDVDNQGINIEVGVDSFTYTVEDANGNIRQGTIRIDIVDDVPRAVEDTKGVEEGGVAEGNVLTNDIFGADGAAAGGGVVAVQVNDASKSVVDGAGTSIEGSYGTLVLNADGNYRYTVSPDKIPTNAEEDVFTYTIKDGDGDLSSTTLTIKVPGSGEPEPEGPELIVGSNADDNPDQTTQHTVPSDGGPNSGAIEGGGGHDILVGDTGASRVVAGQTANLILVLDSSGSMSEPIQFNGSTISRMEALKLATLSLLDSLADSGADNVRINLIDFNETASSLGVFDLVVNGVKNEAGLMAAKEAINGMQDDGWTNYEDGLQAAAEWIGSTDIDAPYNNADLNQVLFISDGEPNTWNNNTGGVEGKKVSYSNTTKALEEVLGSDSINDVQGIINSGWSIEAIGIGLNDNPVLINAATLKNTDLNSSSENDRGYFIESSDGVNLALVSAWSSTGELINTTYKGMNTGVASDYIGATEKKTGVSGVIAKGLSDGEMLRFDFSGGSDYDGSGDYRTQDFNGPLANEAEFEFSNFNSSTNLNYRVFYTDGSSSTLLSVNGAQAGVSIVAPAGKIIDYVEFKAQNATSTSNGYIRLNSITAISALAILDQIEGENGQAVNVESAEDLSDVVGSLGGSQELNPAGDDNILGGDGDDIIFGDVLFTDALAQAAGLNTLPGDGWLVFQQLEAGGGQAGYENWTRSDTLAYIGDPINHNELAQESGRAGGHDIIHGGDGDDIIFGQEGNDLINGGTGNNTLSGGSGDDTFQFTETDVGSINIITDFGSGNDILDLSDLLSGEENGNLSNYLNFSINGNDTLLEVSPTGTGAGEQQFIRFENVDLLDVYGAGTSSELINAMLNDQTLIVDQP